MSKRQWPLLWGGIFLALVLFFGFALWGQEIPLHYPSSGLKFLQWAGLAQFKKPSVLWEYAAQLDDIVLIRWDDGNFASLRQKVAGTKLITLAPTGEEIWRREVPSGGIVVSQGDMWAVIDGEQGEVALYQVDGHLAWRQKWSWPLQNVVISPAGEVLAFLDPLQESDGNLVEKMVFVKADGQAAWEHIVRNGSILTGGFTTTHVGVNQFMFHQESLLNQFIILDKEGNLEGKLNCKEETFFLDVCPVAENTWVLAGQKVLYYVTNSGEVCQKFFSDRSLQRLVPPPLQPGALVTVTFGDGFGSGSVVAFLDTPGNSAWERGFSTPAKDLLVEVTPTTIIVADGKGIYGFNYAGEIKWYYPATDVINIAVAPLEEQLLVYTETGVITMLELPVVTEGV
ncbi:MAG: PQQ-binding-like beta-propeller repeat protein [bacterium]